MSTESPTELRGSALGNQYALHALCERRAEVAGELAELQRRVRGLKRNLTNLDATMHLLAPGFDTSSIPPMRPRTKLFGAGGLNRLILDALRRGARTYEALADRMKSHGFDETKASIANKLARATVPAAFFLGCLAAQELEGVRLEDL